MSHTLRPAPAAWVGIDVSQHTLDVCLLPADGKPHFQVFANDGPGHAALRAWAIKHAGGATLGFCLESTGAYGEGLAQALTDAGQYVSVVNPARVKYAGLMRRQGNKTDRADAKLIAEYATRERPPAWQPPRPEVRELQALVRRRDDLRALAAGEKGRLAAPGLSRAARQSIRRTVAFLEREADLRLTRQNNRIYLDLAKDQGDLVEITGAVWRVTTECPVPFVRPEIMPALPLPEQDGNACCWLNNQCTSSGAITRTSAPYPPGCRSRSFGQIRSRHPIHSVMTFLGCRVRAVMLQSFPKTTPTQKTWGTETSEGYPPYHASAFLFVCCRITISELPALVHTAGKISMKRVLKKCGAAISCKARFNLPRFPASKIVGPPTYPARKGASATASRGLSMDS